MNVRRRPRVPSHPPAAHATEAATTQAVAPEAAAPVTEPPATGATDATDVEIRRSARRKRSVTAYREDGRTIVVVPARMSRNDVDHYVAELVARIDRSERRARRSDADLMARATQLSRRYLGGEACPSSVRWVDNQRKRWGSATPVDGSIRLSSRLATMPAYVIDYVLLHELAHLIVSGHGPEFDALLTDYPALVRAQAFLAGVSHADQHGREAGDDAVCDDMRRGRVDDASGEARSSGDGRVRRSGSSRPEVTSAGGLQSGELALFD